MEEILTPEDVLSMEEWLTTHCEHCGAILAYCSCAEGDTESHEEPPR